MKELKNRSIPYKIYLSEDEMPRYWYNVRADMKNEARPPAEPRHPSAHDGGGDGPRVLRRAGKAGDGQRIPPYIPIPEDVRNFYKMYRPSPLVRAYCLEEKLGTPAQDLLQVRGQQHLRQPQAELRHRSGLLRQGAGSRPA